MSSSHARFAAIAAAVLSVTAVSATNAYAIVPTSTHSVNTDANGLAMQGYDPVAYFTVGAPQKGNPLFKVTRDGATYFFSNAENKKRFEAEPTAYLPQYGGFCAMGTANGMKFEGNPNVWKVVDNKLYLNFNPDVGRRWNEDVPTHIVQANDHWPAIKSKTPEELSAQ